MQIHPAYTHEEQEDEGSGDADACTYWHELMHREDDLASLYTVQLFSLNDSVFYTYGLRLHRDNNERSGDEYLSLLHVKHRNDSHG